MVVVTVSTSAFAHATAVAASTTFFKQGASTVKKPPFQQGSIQPANRELKGPAILDVWAGTNRNSL
jgi:hypothetical protein